MTPQKEATAEEPFHSPEGTATPKCKEPRKTKVQKAKDEMGKVKGEVKGKWKLREK